MGRNILNYNKKFKLICILLVGLVISLFQDPLFSSAADSERKTVKVGYYENELFERGAAEGEIKTGYAYDYYLKLSEYTGWKYEYVYGSFADLYQMLVDGEIDLLAGLAYKEDRAELISYPDIAMGSTNYNLVKLDDNYEITSEISSISGHTIGVLNSAVADSLENYLSEHDIRATVIRYDDSGELFDAFDAKEIDLLAAEGEGTGSRSNYQVLVTFGQSDFYLAVNKERQDLLDELNEAQISLYSNEPYFVNDLRTNYYAASVSAKALTADEIQWLSEHDSVTVGYLNDYLPYCGNDEDGKTTGIIKELIPAIFSAVDVEDIKINYVGYDSYDDMIAAINNGEIDIAFPVGGGVYYSEQNGIYQSSPFVSARADLIFEKVVVNPDNATFAVNGNNSLQIYYIKSKYPNAKIVEYADTDECLKAVLDEEVDCTTLNGLRANEILRNSKYKKLSIRQLSDGIDGCLGVSYGDMGLLRLINRGIHVLGSDYAENIAYKYTKGLYTYSFADWVNDNLVAFLVIIIVFVLSIIILLTVQIRNLKLNIAVLSNANKNQIMFIDSISNIIKEPIDKIVGISDMAMQVSDDEILLKDSLESIHDSSSHMLSVIDDMVAMSLLKQKKVTLEHDKINIIDFVKELDKTMSKKAEEKNISLKVEMKELLNKDLIVDEARLQQALENILNNAIEYTAEGGHVNLTVEQKPSKIFNIAKYEFTIKDDGIGMSDGFQAIALEPFTKEDVSPEGLLKGSGLGLAISRNIIELMGGKISLSSKKNHGTTVLVKVNFNINYNSTK